MTALRAEGGGIALRAMSIKSALRDLLSVSYSMISITSISHLRWLPPFWCLTAPPFPRKRGHYKAPLCCEPLMKGLLCRALLSHRSARGRWWRQPPKGDAFPTPAGRTSPAQRYYITPEGESPQPACKAKPITGRTLAVQGRKARRLAQPSRP